MYILLKAVTIIVSVKNHKMELVYFTDAQSDKNERGNAMKKNMKKLVANAIALTMALSMTIGSVPIYGNAQGVTQTVISEDIQDETQEETQEEKDNISSPEMEALTSETEEMEAQIPTAGAIEALKEQPKSAGNWEFAYFGTSTDSDVNTLVSGTGIGADVDLSQKNDAVVSMTSCSQNADGSINKKGGKFVATDGYDGISYYYTKVKAGEENFYLQADVTVDYINPAPDGQEGFALLARDSVGTNGGSDGAWYTNSCATIGTKLSFTDADGVLYENVKDIVGYRCFSGIKDTVNAPKAGSFTLNAGGFDKEKIKKSGTYTISLEETNSAYIMTYYTKDGSGNLNVVNSYKQYKPSAGNDPLEVIDKNYEYVGFAVARGLNATFSNIIYKVSNAADDEAWQPRPSEYIEPAYEITSPKTASNGKYKLVFKANADGVAKVVNNTTKETIQSDIKVKADEKISVDCVIEGDTEFAVEFKPNDDYKFNDYTFLSSYDAKTITKEVKYRNLSDTVYVAANGKETNTGKSFDDALDINTALSHASAGQTIILKAETYEFTQKLKIERGRDGAEGALITVETDPSSENNAIFDFKQTGEGMEIWGDYWNFKRINITNTKSGSKGCQVSGSHNILEMMNFYNNGNSGLQISGSSAETIAMWPSYNTIKNCTSMNNADKAMEDADGFAAKLTTGHGNVFDGCIAAYNADDGWDLFAKTATGQIGQVTIKNSLAYRNGFLIVDDKTNDDLDLSYIKNNLGAKNMQESACTFDGSNFGIPVINGSNVSFLGTAINSGNGNGFKMGGSALAGAHILKNSVSYENKAKGIDSNSCPDIKVYDSISYNNGNFNVALYSNKNINTDFYADGVISFRDETAKNALTIGEKISLFNQTDLITTSNGNYLWNEATQTSQNASGTVVTKEAFASLDTSVEPVREKDGSINMHGLLALTDKAPNDSGADLNDKQKDITLWVVGDSTVSAFSDKYYMPRYGWGTQLNKYFNSHVTVKNLAISGTSSKSFMTNANYQTLLDGIKEDDCVIIGFGHNDEKTGDSTFTSGSGDYNTQGSFANSLYENYIKKAQEKNASVVLVTPIARRNTSNDYSGESGHITSFGDYAQSVRDLGKALNITVCDLTAQTIALNTQLDTDSDANNDSMYMHAWTSSKATSVDNTHTNMFGAAVNAYLIAKDIKDSNCAMAAYVKKSIADPMNSIEYYKKLSVNQNYEEPVYNRPTAASTTWPKFTDKNGNIWYASVFGDVGSGNTTSKEAFYLGTDANNDMQINTGIAKNTGKIAGTSDGIAMYYVRIPVKSSFSLKADVKLNSYNTAKKPTKQAGFGLMVRDDMYVDEYVSTTMGDYVVAGTVFQSANLNGYNTYARKNGTLTYEGGSLAKAPAVGDTITLEISSTTDGYKAKFGDNEAVIAGYDFALTSIDGDYVYVGMFASRTVDISVSNIELTINGKQMKNYDSYAEKIEQDESGDIALVNAKLKKTSYTYTGKAIKPAVVIEGLTLGNDYTVSYKNNKKIGTAKVTVTGKGSYTGTKVLTFKITPKKVSLTSAKNTDSKAITVKWKKSNTADGYYVQYSTDKKFSKKATKTVKVKNAKTVSKTIKKLKKNKTYYVRVCAYKNGVKGTYSSVKKVKIKK